MEEQPKDEQEMNEQPIENQAIEEQETDAPAQEEEGEEFTGHHIIQVDPKQSSIRIDKFLMDKLKFVTRNRIQRGIKEGFVLVNDKEIKTNYKIRPNDTIRMFMDKNYGKPTEVLPEDIPLDVHYEDDDVLVINKPPGLVVHPGVGNWTGTLVNALAHYIGSENAPVMEGNNIDRPYLVHRIDKDTSGLMVIAKNETALQSLSKQFFNHDIKRRYQALVWSAPEEPQGTIDVNIGRHPRNRFEYTTFPEGDFGKHAITHYKVLEDMYYVTLVECELETGRTHQIRVHMKSIGCPLFNDTKYGGSSIRKGTVYSKYKQFVDNAFKLMPRQALHAKVLGFTHPTIGEGMYFESELPEDFSNALDKWRKYVETKK